MLAVRNGAGTDVERTSGNGSTATRTAQAFSSVGA